MLESEVVARGASSRHRFERAQRLLARGDLAGARIELEAVSAERPDDADVWYLLAMIFDMLDGKVARMAGVTSSFGAYLDSLSDAISFGVAIAGKGRAVSSDNAIASRSRPSSTVASFTTIARSRRG